MANNCMWLVNTATGQRVLIAKHLATEWYTPATPVWHPTYEATKPPTFEERIEAAFKAEVEDHDAIWGSTAWRIEYETDEPEQDAALKERCQQRAKEGARTDDQDPKEGAKTDDHDH